MTLFLPGLCSTNPLLARQGVLYDTAPDGLPISTPAHWLVDLTRQIRMTFWRPTLLSALISPGHRPVISQRHRPVRHLTRVVSERTLGLTAGDQAVPLQRSSSI